MYNQIVKLIEKYKTASKYFCIGLDLKCENVTLSSVPIVKCMGKYENKLLV